MPARRTWLETRLWALWSHLVAYLHTGLSRYPRWLRWGHRVPLFALRRYETRHRHELDTDSMHLHHFEASTHSQNGEDGIVAEIFRRIGAGNRFFVEIGASDGGENCTAALLEAGWGGVWIEGDHDKVVRARAATDSHPVEVVEAFVDRTSIVPALRDVATPPEPDLLVIDVDGNDYWIWEAVSTAYRPRVVVIEYNSAVGPRWHWIMPYDPNHQWDGSVWHGAGIAALVQLGRRFGYQLVGCDSLGVNAFFVRSDEVWPVAATTRQLWVPPRCSLPYDLPWSGRDPFDLAPLSPVAAEGISIRAFPPRQRTLRTGETIYFDVEVTNDADVPIGCSGAGSTQLAYWWTDASGDRLDGEPTRCPQSWRAESGSSTMLVAQVCAPPWRGSFELVVSLVQEGICWIDSATHRLGTWSVA